MITNGKEGLKIVAETGGSWNWVLLGPNPEALPLAGGGAGGVDDMRECIRKTEDECDQANLYGVLRMEFGTGKIAKRKFVFVRASKLDDTWKAPERKAGRATLVGHGHAGALVGVMEEAINEFCHTIARVEVHSVDELTLELVLDKLSKASQADSDIITMAKYQEALTEFQKTVQPVAFTREVRAVEAVLANRAPKPEVYEAKEEGAEHEEKAAEAAAPTEGEELRPLSAPETASIILSDDQASNYKEGSLVICFSSSTQQWLDDGVVIKVLPEDGVHDQMQLTAGSIKVCYNNRKTFKWLLPEQIEQFVKPSGRPRPPQSLYGDLFKETHNWITSWHVRYFDLSKGYLQWWPSKEEAKQGCKPNGSLYLSGMEMNLEGTVFRIRTRTSQGIVYAFDATTAESADAWKAGLVAHEEYCRALAKYFAEKSGSGGEGDAVTEQINKKLDAEPEAA
mmetsp:Transcript_70883/g.148279  ORF Transcript_70883/g.148279 Transcript_70883/m.148279 type:complete len:453 (-) Transcript_70883:53-1411(-)|eukprot:CAMPEP_0206460568 /NCGR_PEP_ID=MMETSP0324_2-20121206/24824_1 /ASSEMBLY_ACC=CAM_ASM_000836 /TAXON_ID=2866 /ORGANISM="Crypthecodinium cohnii, Strain Seligo" /LENGTH=452 /DNA_ID=CAMNT_0053932285 /DNA_START=75 /DNA_END=1433 /DNA_ORIENTATION=-